MVFYPNFAKNTRWKVLPCPLKLSNLHILTREFSTLFQIFPPVLPLKYPRRYGKIVKSVQFRFLILAADPVGVLSARHVPAALCLVFRTIILYFGTILLANATKMW